MRAALPPVRVAKSRPVVSQRRVGALTMCAAADARQAASALAGAGHVRVPGALSPSVVVLDKRPGRRKSTAWLCQNVPSSYRSIAAPPRRRAGLSRS
jgi:hypothetical protein